MPIGTAIETEGVLLRPTAAGYDIGCGMVQLETSLTADDVADVKKRRAWMERGRGAASASASAKAA